VGIQNIKRVIHFHKNVVFFFFLTFVFRFNFVWKAVSHLQLFYKEDLSKLILKLERGKIYWADQPLTEARKRSSFEMRLRRSHVA
jgi:hypothetical protein